MKPTAKTELHSLQYNRAAGFVLLLSVVLILEGVSRCNLQIGTPAGSWTGDHQTFPPVVLLVSAVGLLFYGLMGLALGFAGVVFSAGSATVTTVYLAVEFVLGWFFFTCNVLAAYPFMVARAPGPMPGLNGRESNAVIMMGFLGSIGLGVPVLAAHFFFVLQMLRIQRGEGAVYTHQYLRARAYFYGALLTFKGVAEMSLGTILCKNIGKSRFLPPMVSLPFVVSYCQISTAVGVLIIILGLSCFVVATLNIPGLVIPYCAASFFVLVVQLACSDMTQIGLLSAVPGAPLLVGAIVSWNLIVMTMIPAYLIAHIKSSVRLGVEGESAA